MKLYQPSNPSDVRHYDTKRLRDDFLIEKIFEEGEITFHYSFIDRIIVGGIQPKVSKPIVLKGAFERLRNNYFLERREIGIINLGNKGRITVDGVVYDINRLDCLYIGKGAKELIFESVESVPAQLYFASTPAHTTYPTVLCLQKDAIQRKLGTKSECNSRTIYQFVVPDNIKSCQLALGVTLLDDGSVWNTMPCHTHDRRMEVYMYTDIKEGQAVFHYMGQPQETRHILVHNNQAVISPSWSIHSGVGTQNYSFVWAMCGENQTYDDMDHVKTTDLR